MRTLIIDRFEGSFAICEELAKEPAQKGAEKAARPAKNAKELKFFGIDRGELPEGAKEGSVLTIDDNGVLALDEEAAKARRDKINGLQKKLWEK